MPELPEVETIVRGIKPHLYNQSIAKIIVRQPQLRWRIPNNLNSKLVENTIKTVERRAKYLLIHLTNGTLIIHLGMSGRLRILTNNFLPQKHDHVDIILKNNMILRYTDPRRFGAILWTDQNCNLHPLLKNLGIEPLSKKFSGNYLYQLAKQKNIPIKSFIMDSQIVVGVGNIYANEALFLAKIHPLVKTKKINQSQFDELAEAIKLVLKKAIKQGGTTLKDFVNSEGKPGYFTQFLKVYGRAGLECVNCADKLEAIRINQRTTVYCPSCQFY